MQISTLISHCSELIQIILKSSQPADLIASKYFRAKKYIGSKERKFISETVFTSLRIKVLIEFFLILFPNDSTSKLLKNSDNKKLYNSEQNSLYFCLIFSTLFLANNFLEKKLFSPVEIIKKIICQNNLDFDKIINEALAYLLNVDLMAIQDFTFQLSKQFIALDEEAKNIRLKYQNSSEKINSDNLDIICYRYSFPQFLFKNIYLSGYYKHSLIEIIDLAESLMQAAPIIIRVNSILSKTNKVLSYFLNQNIDCEKSRLSPDGITIYNRVLLKENDLFKNGVIEIQDDASQVVSFAFESNKYKSLLDACAGAGGKSLHLAAINQDSCNIVSSDIEFNKLKELNKRAKRAGFKSIKTHLLKNKDFEKQNYNPYNMMFDAILIDAPCSGTGTVRRSPMIKYQLDAKQLKKRADVQLKLINYFSRFLKPGGILVYSTCSILPQENEEIITKFLDENQDFRPDALKPVFESNNVFIDFLTENDYFVTLLPSKFNCDGFFIARLRKFSEINE